MHYTLLLLVQQISAESPGAVTQLVPWGGVALAGTVSTVLLRFVERNKQEAIAAERRRADDWRVTAEAASARADERDRQMWTMLSAIKDSAGAA